MSGELKLPFDKVLMDIIKDMVFIVEVEQDATFTYAYLNRAAIEKTELNEDSIGKTFSEVQDIAHANQLNAYYKNVLNSKTVFIYEDSYKSPSQATLYSTTQLTPLLDDTGVCTYIVGIVKDKTNEKLAQMNRDQAMHSLMESKSRYQSLYDNNSDAVLTINLEGIVLSGNFAFQELAGYMVDEVIGTEIMNYFDSEDRKFMSNSIHYAVDTKHVDNRTILLHKSGEHISCLVRYTPIVVQSEVVGIYVILKDMRELEEMIGKFNDSEKNFRIIAENAEDVIILLNHQNEYVYISPSIKDVYGFVSKEEMSPKLFQYIHHDDIPLLKENLVWVHREKTTVSLQLRLQHKLKHWVWSEMKITPVHDEEGVKHLVIIIRDITMQKNHEKQLEHFAYHDSLTGLPNRRYFTDQLSSKVECSPENNERFAVFILDMDHFKEINDRFGHDFGDEVIQEFAKRLKESIGQDDFAARYGGDEFVILMTHLPTEEHIRKTANTILNAMSAPWLIQNTVLEVTVSMGIALSPIEGTTSSAILKYADDALYKVKNTKRNSFHIHD